MLMKHVVRRWHIEQGEGCPSWLPPEDGAFKFTSTVNFGTFQVEDSPRPPPSKQLASTMAMRRLAMLACAALAAAQLYEDHDHVQEFTSSSAFEKAILEDDAAMWVVHFYQSCLLYTSPSPRDATLSRMPSSA